MSSSIRQQGQCGENLVWAEAKPYVITLAAHIVIFSFAALCFMAMLIISYGLLVLCEILFKDYEIYVKAACIIGEVLLCIYLSLRL